MWSRKNSMNWILYGKWNCANYAQLSWIKDEEARRVSWWEYAQYVHKYVQVCICVCVCVEIFIYIVQLDSRQHIINGARWQRQRQRRRWVQLTSAHIYAKQKANREGSRQFAIARCQLPVATPQCSHSINMANDIERCLCTLSNGYIHFDQ